MPEQADAPAAGASATDAAVIASLEHALAQARAQYALLRRTLDEVVAHRHGIGAERV